MIVGKKLGNIFVLFKNITKKVWEYYNKYSTTGLVLVLSADSFFRPFKLLKAQHVGVYEADFM